MNLKLHALVIFRKLLNDPVLGQLSAMLSGDKTPEAQVSGYASFVAALFEQGSNLTEYVLGRVLEDENIYVQRRGQKAPIDTALEACLMSELKALEEVSQLTSDEVQAQLDYDGYLPSWTNSSADFVAVYMDRMEALATCGYGAFSKHHMFSVKDGEIVPVKWPDGIRLTDFKGYERQRNMVVSNTLALLKGKPAANVLLFGDAGTGKSSTVKAVVNEYHNQGLRLIEITKKQVGHIPAIVETLSKNPLKFILFIDDLSFAQENDDFYALKAVLEGSVSAKTPNLAIYATSNRRHLVKESFSDRNGDDVHRNETIQELCSLSARFGMTVGYFKPNKQQYLEIVHSLKEKHGIKMDGTQLEMEAERYASNGRSPRTARQFVEHLKSMEE